MSALFRVGRDASAGGVELITVGLQMAAEDGTERPSREDAVWQLIREAARTLKRLPDRERGWLLSGETAHWPACRLDASEAFGLAVELGSIGEDPSVPMSPPRPSPAAVDRLYVVMGWMPLVKGKNRRRDIQVLWLLGGGVRPVRLTALFGCGRRTIYDIRDRCCRQIAVALEPGRVFASFG